MFIPRLLCVLSPISVWNATGSHAIFRFFDPPNEMALVRRELALPSLLNAGMRNDSSIQQYIANTIQYIVSYIIFIANTSTVCLCLTDISI